MRRNFSVLEFGYAGRYENEAVKREKALKQPLQFNDLDQACYEILCLSKQFIEQQAIAVDEITVNALMLKLTGEKFGAKIRISAIWGEDKQAFKILIDRFLFELGACVIKKDITGIGCLLVLAEEKDLAKRLSLGLDELSKYQTRKNSQPVKVLSYAVDEPSRLLQLMAILDISVFSCRNLLKDNDSEGLRNWFSIQDEQGRSLLSFALKVKHKTLKLSSSETLQMAAKLILTLDNDNYNKLLIDTLLNDCDFNLDSIIKLPMSKSLISYLVEELIRRIDSITIEQEQAKQRGNDLKRVFFQLMQQAPQLTVQAQQSAECYLVAVLKQAGKEPFSRMEKEHWAVIGLLKISGYPNALKVLDLLLSLPKASLYSDFKKACVELAKSVHSLSLTGHLLRWFCQQPTLYQQLDYLLELAKLPMKGEDREFLQQQLIELYQKKRSYKKETVGGCLANLASTVSSVEQGERLMAFYNSLLKTKDERNYAIASAGIWLLAKESSHWHQSIIKQLFEFLAKAGPKNKRAVCFLLAQMLPLIEERDQFASIMNELLAIKDETAEFHQAIFVAYIYAFWYWDSSEKIIEFLNEWLNEHCPDMVLLAKMELENNSVHHSNYEEIYSHHLPYLIGSSTNHFHVYWYLTALMAEQADNPGFYVKKMCELLKQDNVDKVKHQAFSCLSRIKLYRLDDKEKRKVITIVTQYLHSSNNKFRRKAADILAKLCAEATCSSQRLQLRCLLIGQTEAMIAETKLQGYFAASRYREVINASWVSLAGAVKNLDECKQLCELIMGYAERDDYLDTKTIVAAVSAMLKVAIMLKPTIKLKQTDIAKWQQYFTQLLGQTMLSHKKLSSRLLVELFQLLAKFSFMTVADKILLDLWCVLIKNLQDESCCYKSRVKTLIVELAPVWINRLNGNSIVDQFVLNSKDFWRDDREKVFNAFIDRATTERAKKHLRDLFLANSETIFDRLTKTDTATAMDVSCALLTGKELVKTSAAHVKTGLFAGNNRSNEAMKPPQAAAIEPSVLKQ